MLAPIQGYQENAWCLHDHSPLFTLKNSSDVSPMDSNRCACSYRPWSLLRKHSRPPRLKKDDHCSSLNATLHPPYSPWVILLTAHGSSSLPSRFMHPPGHLSFQVPSAQSRRTPVVLGTGFKGQEEARRQDMWLVGQLSLLDLRSPTRHAGRPLKSS